MKTYDDVWNDRAYDIGKERDDEKSQQNDKIDYVCIYGGGLNFAGA